jgi:hypothetical protein
MNNLGFGIRPAQSETITSGYAGAVHIPIVQSFFSVVFASLGILFVWILLFVIGPDVLWIAGFAAIVVVARRVLLLVGKVDWTLQYEKATEHEGEKTTEQKEIDCNRAMTIGACAIAVLLLGAWAASRQFCVDMWPATLPPVSAWRVIFAVTFIIPPIAVCALMALSFAINAYNPASFQPMMAKPSGTPWWSPTGQTITNTEPEDDEYEQVAQAFREIPRPVPAYGNGNPNPNGSKVQERLTDASERQHRTPTEPEGLPEGAFIAPNGRITRIEDLAEFLMDGVSIGATYQTWKRRKGWGENYWQAIYGTCSQHGFAKPSRIKSRSKLLVGSRREAAQAVEHLRRHLFPSPPPAP